MIWKRFADEMPPERPGVYALLHGARKEPMLIRWHSITRAWEGDWSGPDKSIADIQTAYDDGDLFTHWMLIERPEAA
jgi:hypothetical protein